MSEFRQGTSLLVNSSLKIDYEALSPNHKLWVHLVAGSIAGVAEHCVMFPLDSFKTRVQSLCPCLEASCSTPIHGVFSIIKKEGWLRPLRGVNAVALGSVPAHALYFSVYEKMKNFLTTNKVYSNTLSYGIAGASATIVHDLVMNPFEVVKQRMQMIYSPYCSSIECIKCIYHIEGFYAFYRSYTTQLLINIPFQSIHFMTYEFFQQMLNFERSYNPKVHLLAGGMAGGLAAAITTPIDCIKTVLNTQQNSIVNIDARNKLLIKSNYIGFFDAVYSIYNNRGLNGFIRGIQARIMYQMPATALSWSVYEFFKFILCDKEASLRIF